MAATRDAGRAAAAALDPDLAEVLARLRQTFGADVQLLAVGPRQPATNGHDDGTAGSAAAMQPQLPDTAEPPEAPEVSR
jgi:hypothetical protein